MHYCDSLKHEWLYFTFMRFCSTLLLEYRVDCVCLPVECFATLSGSGLHSNNDRIIGELLIGMDLEGSDYCVIEALFSA